MQVLTLSESPSDNSQYAYCDIQIANNINKIYLITIADENTAKLSPEQQEFSELTGINVNAQTSLNAMNVINNILPQRFQSGMTITRSNSKYKVNIRQIDTKSNIL